MRPLRSGFPLPSHVGVALCAASAAALLASNALLAQEVRGFAKRNSGGDAVWGATVQLMDSLGREAATTRTNRHGEFVVRAPIPGTYWLQLSERTVGSKSSPVFVLDSGSTMHYDHVFQMAMRDRLLNPEVTAQSVLPERFSDSTAGIVYRGIGQRRVPQVSVTVLDAKSEEPLQRVEVALVAIDPRFTQVMGNKTDDDGHARWQRVERTWYRVIARKVGFAPAGTRSFPIVSDADSINVVVRMQTVTILDAVTVMENQVNAFGFNLNLMKRNYLSGDALRERNPSARNIDDLIMSIRIPGLSLRTGIMRSQMTYRGAKVRVFILDGSRTGGELPEIEPSAVESLLFVPPNEAGAVFGPDAIGGVLIINTRKR